MRNSWQPYVISLAMLAYGLAVNGNAAENAMALKRQAAYRGPVDLVVFEEQALAATANELANTISLVDLRTREVIDEVQCGARPSAIAKLLGPELLVSCRDAGFVERFVVESETSGTPRLKKVASIHTGFAPLGIAADLAQHRAFVGLIASGEVAVIDLAQNKLVARWTVGDWPRYLALSPDGSRLAVGLSGQSEIAVLDTASGETVYSEPLSGGINIGHLKCSADGQYVYFPWMIYRTNPIDVSNIRRGWVLASRIGRVRLDGPAYRQAISLDVPRLAVADPHGLAMTPDEHRMAVTSAGTHELLVYRLGDLPFVGAGGPGDLIDNRLLQDSDLFYRIELGGRPMGIVAGSNNRTVFVANHTSDSLQIVDIESRRVTHSISLGTQPADPQLQLVHRGMEIFHDAGRSLDQWYSCNSCHLDGGSNAKAMDTWNDGTSLTAKSVLPLTGVSETGPWTWHGWQQDLDALIQNSFIFTMQGKAASADDVAAMRAYLTSLALPANPYANDADKQAVASSLRGRELFMSSEVGCSVCHAGPNLSDGEIHDVGLGSDSDKYEGYNTPSLRGVYQKVRLLHDGRARSLRDVLTKWHTPEEIGGGAELDDQQIGDLIAYLRSL